MINSLNRKGFTLVELLAVMIVLLAISAFTISSISAAIERNKKSSNDAKIAVLESYAKIYYDDTHKKCIELKDLKKTFNLSEEELCDAYGNDFVGIMLIDENDIPYFNSEYSKCN